YISQYANGSGSPGMKLGHIQIRVGDIVKGRSFYVDTVGFYITNPLTSANSLFLSDGYYHHDLVINQAPNYDGDSIDEYDGLSGFSFDVPDSSYLRKLENRLKVAGTKFTRAGSGITFTD